MRVRDIMSRSILTADISRRLADVCALMRENHMGSVVIIEGRTPAGIITERDVVNAVAHPDPSLFSLPVHRLMRRPLITVPPDLLIREAAEYMKRHRIRRLPVLSNGRLVGIVTAGDVLRGILRELTDASLRAERLSDEVRRDALTGVGTRRYFDHVLEREVDRVRAYGGELSLMMVDVDRFKQVNDRYGHHVGDLVLRRIAALLRRTARGISTVARFGGDEFAVIAPISSPEALRRVGERCRELAHRMVFRSGRRKFTVSLSIGVAGWNRTMRCPKDLIARADAALYRAKRAGRNCVCMAGQRTELCR